MLTYLLIVYDSIIDMKIIACNYKTQIVLSVVFFTCISYIGVTVGVTIAISVAVAIGVTIAIGVKCHMLSKNPTISRDSTVCKLLLGTNNEH